MTARRPPDELVGLDRRWSRLVTAPDHRGRPATWHLLDTHPDGAATTVLCVHGNPSWSYLFRELCAAADRPDESGSGDVRVVAVDQLDMGFSERTGVQRRLEHRVADLAGLTDELGLGGRVVTLAHDWGGPVSLGWALDHRDVLAGVVLLNTAVHQPEGARTPSLIRIARSRPMLATTTVRTDVFVRGAMALSRRRYDREIADGFLAPYRSSDRRRAIAGFVADIPLEDDHPTAAVLAEIADRLDQLADVPALLLWGARDLVFSDRYLHDLERRLPHAQVHRYPEAGHFVSEDVDVVTPITDWIERCAPGVARPVGDVGPADRPDGPMRRSPMLSPPLAPAATDHVAVAELVGDGVRAIDHAGLVRRAQGIGVALRELGVARHDRVAVMVPPGIDLSACVLGTWHAGASVVLVDGALTPRQMDAAIRAAAPDHLVGIRRALLAARALGWPVERIALDDLSDRAASGTGRDGADAADVAGGTGAARQDGPLVGDEAAVVFTSGSTGPSKGVRYAHGSLAAQRDVVRDHYAISGDDRLVAAFAPFALFGPVLGIASAVPDMDVSSPGTLTAAALADAVAAVDATLVFASPAALASVAATADALTAVQRRSFRSVRMLLSAGAPVRPSLLRATAGLLGAERAHTPYGMTECLPVADIELSEIESANGGDGVCVGRPLSGVEVVVRPLGARGDRVGDDTDAPAVVGEIVVRAAHLRSGYDRLWHTEHLASQPPGWHATGDVGAFDELGRLWVGGRVQHLITAADGLVTPVGPEHRIEELDGVDLAAVVGVGPAGAQQPVAVCVRAGVTRARLADRAVAAQVRSAAGLDLAAVVDVPALPVDRRHNSKIDRTRVAAWADDLLAGGRLGPRRRRQP